MLKEDNVTHGGSARPNTGLFGQIYFTIFFQPCSILTHWSRLYKMVDGTHVYVCILHIKLLLYVRTYMYMLNCACLND